MKPKRLNTIISDDIKYRLNSGEFKVGDKLPSERELATEYAVHRISVNEALTNLALEGIIEIVPRQGSFFLDRRIKKSNTEIQTTAKCIQTANRKVNIEVKFLESTYVNKNMSVKIMKDIGTPIYIYQRLVYLDDNLVSIEKTTVLQSKVKNISVDDLKEIDTYKLYNDKFDLNVLKSEKRLRMVYSNQKENDIFGFEESRYLFKEEGLIYLDTEEILEYVEYIILPAVFEYVG